MPFLPGMKVVAANDYQQPPRVGEVVRLLRRDPVETVNQGTVEEIEIYLIRWPLDDGRTEQTEVPGVSLRAVPARPH
jgi:hypothetical protein